MIDAISAILMISLAVVVVAMACVIVFTAMFGLRVIFSYMYDEYKHRDSKSKDANL